MEAFAFVKAQASQRDLLARALAALECLTGVDLVRGPYDIVARLELGHRDGRLDDIEQLPGMSEIDLCSLSSQTEGA